MVRFGPSGYCEEFLQKYKHSEEIPLWLKENNLDAFEYAFNKGKNN